ncbi:MAG: SemiSWEET transporter, partial [Tolumonas sp.]|nr:SemiSWEET transporter [Tolumonas sp.]
DASLVELLGMTAGCLTTGSFIPQAIKIMRTRDVSGISLLMYIALAVGLMLWLLYGIINGQISIIAANGVTLALVLIILFMKIRYR